MRWDAGGIVADYFAVVLNVAGYDGTSVGAGVDVQSEGGGGSGCRGCGQGCSRCENAERGALGQKADRLAELCRIADLEAARIGRQRNGRCRKALGPAVELEAKLSCGTFWQVWWASSNMWSFDQGRGGGRRPALDRGWERVVERGQGWEAPRHVIKRHAALPLWTDDAVARIVCWERVVDDREDGIAPGHVIKRHAALSLGASDAAARIVCWERVIDWNTGREAPGHVIRSHAALSLWTDDAVARILKCTEWHSQNAERHVGNQKGVDSKGRHINDIR